MIVSIKVRCDYCGKEFDQSPIAVSQYGIVTIKMSEHWNCSDCILKRIKEEFNHV